jgi:CheY-like chemotaxis protein
MPDLDATPAQLPIPAPSAPRVLLVDDDDSVLDTLTMVLRGNGFEVVAAASVNDALRCIAAETFDVLVSDLHMPQPGDGLTVVSAMRHANPKAVTFIFSAFPEMQAATSAILRQADEILVKPLSASNLIGVIRDRLKLGKNRVNAPIESVADILERSTQSTIEEWLESVRDEPQVISAPLSDDDRCAHLPQLFRDLVSRLRHPIQLGTRALVSSAAARHGLLRRRQGYSAAMLVEESRMLQVSIFQTLQDNLAMIDFSHLLVGVMAIADEVDSQLAQQMASYIAESKTGDQPIDTWKGSEGQRQVA